MCEEFSPVTNKDEFRRWCARMQLDSKQAAHLLGLSLSNVYKYLDEKEQTPIRGMVSTVCELINMLGEEERVAWVRKQLHSNSALSPWPSKRPISHP
ncbi:hypothetical protein BM525_20795 (plasmid) [Alteromonas mediterranea]|uniref:Uncharacterized protein n=1 Tax=Alteromonas mediterranea TaxID=314275 RepID=A0AAC9JEJ9_9ALTE|nr:hypothetical protein [Alteromonas mediterranea]APD92303.1 hypothetical protein BM524_20570 [Alteromonas mediterranea]APE00164.1 hypothetical protein BM525_20795 [Alteromonas mediterranea]